MSTHEDLIDAFKGYLQANGYTVTAPEKAAPPLPTEDGFYLDNEGELWQVAPHLPADRLDRKWGPFTRLEPVPVTVEKVIDYLATEHRYHPTVGLTSEIRKHFGVTR